MLLFASLFIIIMNSCQKDDDNDIIVEDPKKDSTSQVIKDLSINVNITFDEEGLKYDGFVIRVESSKLGETGLPLAVESEYEGFSANYTLPNPEDFQGVVTVLFVCFAYTDSQDVRRQVITKKVDLSKESTFNLKFDDLK